jgi:multiple sugar transport system substrate-binding protein
MPSITLGCPSAARDGRPKLDRLDRGDVVDSHRTLPAKDGSLSAARRPAKARGRLIACGAVALGLLLGACTGQGANSGGGGGSSAGGKVTLTFWNGLTGGDRPTIDKLIGQFNATHKDVTVKSVAMPWDVFYQKLLTSVSSGTGPDIVAMDAGQIPKFAANGVLRPVDDIYRSTTYLDTSDLVPAAVSASEFKGKNYGVPLETAPLLLMWNKTMFKKAGLDPQAPPTTWAQFAQDARKLTKDTNHDGKPDQYAIALADHETVPTYQVLLWQGGGGVVSQDGKQATLDDPATLKALQYWVALVRDRKVSPIGLSGADADKLFQTQKAAMEIIGPWVTPTLTQAHLDFGVTMPFAGPGGTRVTQAGVTSLGLSADASPAVRKAAYRFFSFWDSKQSQLTLAKGTGFPPNRTDITAADLHGYPYPAAFGAPDVLRDSRAYLPGLINGPTITDQIFYPALQRVLNGRGSVASVFKQADADVQKQLVK